MLGPSHASRMCDKFCQPECLRRTACKLCAGRDWLLWTRTLLTQGCKSSMSAGKQAGEPAAGGQCTRTGVRRAAGSLVPPGTDVAAVRISAPGWENAVLDGLQVSPFQP